MRRGTIVLLIFVLAAAGIIGVSFLLQKQPPLEITLAVDPLIESWAKDAVAAFNASNSIVGAGRRVQVTIYGSAVDDVRIWNNGANWTTTSHPDAWIASSSVSAGYARDRGLPLQIVKDSLAKTPLIFGGYASRMNILTGSPDDPLTWAEIANAAEKESWSVLGGEANWQFVKLAFGIPNQTMTGLGVILASAGAYHNTTQLTSALLSDSGFQAEAESLIRSVSNFNSIGQDIAAFVARGTATTDIGIAPESQWLNNLSALVKNEAFRLSYPDYLFVFDFPLSRWNDTTLTEDTRQAVDRLGDYLLSANQQAALKQYGLRPANGTATVADALFNSAQQYGVQLNLTLDNTVQPPSLNEMQGLLRSLETMRRGR